jgi:hypothetical protein
MTMMMAPVVINTKRVPQRIQDRRGATTSALSSPPSSSQTPTSREPNRLPDSLKELKRAASLRKFNVAALAESGDDNNKAEAVKAVQKAVADRRTLPPWSHSIGGTEAKQESPHFWTPKKQGSRKFALPTFSRSKSEGDDGAISDDSDTGKHKNKAEAAKAIQKAVMDHMTLPPQSHSIGGTEAKQESPHFWTPKRQGSRKFALPTLSRSKSEGDDGAISDSDSGKQGGGKKQASMDMMLSTADDKQQAASIFQGGSSSNLMASLSCKQGGGKKRASMDMMLSTADDKQWEASIFQGGSSSNLMASLSCKQGGGKKRASMDMMLSTADDKQRAASIFQRDSSSNLMASLSSFSPNKPISLGLPATLPTSSTEGSEDDSFSSCSTSSSCSYSSSSSEEPIKNHTRRRRHPTEEPIPCHSSRPRRRSSLGNEEKPDNNRMSCKSKDLSAFCTPRRTSSRKLQMNGIPDDISITIEEAVEERRGKKSKKGKRSKKKKPKSGGESRSRHLRKSNRSGNGSRKYSSSSSLSAKGEPRTCREVPHRIPRHHKSTDDSLDNYRGSSPGGKRRPPSKDRSASLDNYRGSSHGARESSHNLRLSCSMVLQKNNATKDSDSLDNYRGPSHAKRGLPPRSKSFDESAFCTPKRAIPSKFSLLKEAEDANNKKDCPPHHPEREKIAKKKQSPTTATSQKELIASFAFAKTQSNRVIVDKKQSDDHKETTAADHPPPLNPIPTTMKDKVEQQQQQLLEPRQKGQKPKDKAEEEDGDPTESFSSSDDEEEEVVTLASGEKLVNNKIVNVADAAGNHPNADKNTKRDDNNNDSNMAPSSAPVAKCRIFQREKSMVWTCTCGVKPHTSQRFCGMCGTGQHWKCMEKGCGHDMNLAVFVFCGMCGVAKK